MLALSLKQRCGYKSASKRVTRVASVYSVLACTVFAFNGYLLPACAQNAPETPAQNAPEVPAQNAPETPMTEIPQIDPNMVSGSNLFDGPYAGKSTSEGFIYLDVFINGVNRKALTAFKPVDGDFVINANGLRNAGIIAPKMSIDKDGWVHLSKLPYVQYTYDETNQRMNFNVTKDDLIVPVDIAITERSNFSRLNENREGEGRPTSSPSAVFNYSLYSNANGGNIADAFGFDGVSGSIESRFSSKMGVLYNNEVVSHFNGDNSSARLDTYYSYSDDDRMITYRAGDILTRNLQWSRSARLGGFQIRRNFALRNDLITMPLPTISGSAAVPSTVDLYINNVKYGSRDVENGPFTMTNLPVITGSGTARIVTRDAMGRETVVENSFYVSPNLLSKGLLDFSVDIGAPRLNYGTNSFNYDSKIYGSSSVRYGLTNHFTLEGHGEAGEDLYNFGLGGVFNIGAFGVGSLSASTSSFKGKTGNQMAASLSFQYRRIGLNLFSQRTFSDYNDIASASNRNRYASTTNTDTSMTPDTTGGATYYNGSQFPRQTNQASINIPLGFDPTSLSFAFTEVRYNNSLMQKWRQDNSRIISASLSRNFIKNGYGYLSAFKELGKDRMGIYAGFTYTFNNKYYASVSSNTDYHKTSVSSQLTRSMSEEIGDYGWTLRDMEGDKSNRGASGQYRARIARLSGSVEQSDNDSYNANANIEGAVVIADKSIFLSNPIYDSFAIADVGAPNVMVTSQNRPYGKTGRNGKILVTNLVSYFPNRISVDPATLPDDVLLEQSSVNVIPADQSGVVASFNAKGGDEFYIVTLVNEAGEYIPAGSLAVGQSSSFNGVVGYEGQLLVTKSDLNLPEKIKIMDMNLQCWAELTNSMATGLDNGGNRIVCRK